ncbi:hypothetical protein [sulfur-oxidizing endosymbiont of Gigantopelta aegis]|uniref:hypothetical protein n=1 Tax=sulfur-oxidizing endosymbiont of Gigantopelta aegis TaxID=2794934 RepID=UPI0018DD452A|nr:hypothetical protein [sulfur-oxidizing endosymbiont of Gigantopelta aegis]
MSQHKTAQVFIDNVTIRVPSGWQGDPNLLARKIAEQIQAQSTEIQSVKQLSLTLQGHFMVQDINAISEQLSKKLSEQLSKTSRGQQ